jgi:amino acid transporter
VSEEAKPGAPTGSAKLFVRQSSGLVRNVSVTNALFFNVAAFVGVGLTLYPIFYSLGFVPVWKFAGISEYGWAAIIAGLFCAVLALIFASLTSVMPRSGGDYVFTSRIVHPFLGWMESWTLVIASVLIMAFEVPLVLRNLQITARIIGIVVALPTRTFHRVVTALAGFGVAGFIAMFIFGLLTTSRSDFERHLPQYTNGVTAQQIAASGKADFLAGTSHHFLSDLFSTTVFPFMLSILLFQFIGFQYSAYIAGEVRGNVRRGVMVALLGALLIGVLANSLYVDAISNHFGFGTNVSWGASYWGFNGNLTTLPLGQPNSMPLLAVIANSSLWPIWALISFAGTIFPFLLCPVYINFISRMQLAWSLDRQLPEWFGRVNERLRAPLNAILATLALAAVFLFFQSYNALPHFLATTGNKLNLAGTAWFAIVMALLTWTMPGVNALLVRFRRPDLVRNAPFGRALPWLGIVWLVFPVWIYIFAVFKPIEKSLEGGGKLHYLETNGILDAVLFYAIGVVIYVLMLLRSRSAGVDTKMLFTEIPPD